MDIWNPIIMEFTILRIHICNTLFIHYHILFMFNSIFCKKTVNVIVICNIASKTIRLILSIINYTVEVANACGVEMPKVAPLAAVEVVNEKMPCCVEAAQLTKWNEEGRITGCIVDGPLSMDLAIDPEASKHKAGAASRKIVGNADILLFPDIHAGNMVYKTITHLTEFKNGCILTGTKAPVVLTSRSDSFETKINSIALAAVLAEHMNKKG